MAPKGDPLPAEQIAGDPTGVGEATSRELLRSYYACTSFVAAQIGRVLAELEALGLREITIRVCPEDDCPGQGDTRARRVRRCVSQRLRTRRPLAARASQRKELRPPC